MKHCQTCRCEDEAQTKKLPLDYLPPGYELLGNSYGVEVVDENGRMDPYLTKKLAEDTDGYRIIQFGDINE